MLKLSIKWLKTKMNKTKTNSLKTKMLKTKTSHTKSQTDFSSLKIKTKVSRLSTINIQGTCNNTYIFVRILDDWQSIEL